MSAPCSLRAQVLVPLSRRGGSQKHECGTAGSSAVQPLPPLPGPAATPSSTGGPQPYGSRMKERPRWQRRRRGGGGGAGVAEPATRMDDSDR
jgi:hypothetical protein